MIQKISCTAVTCGSLIFELEIDKGKFPHSWVRSSQKGRFKSLGLGLKTRLGSSSYREAYKRSEVKDPTQWGPTKGHIKGGLGDPEDLGYHSQIWNQIFKKLNLV